MDYLVPLLKGNMVTQLQQRERENKQKEAHSSQVVMIVQGTVGTTANTDEGKRWGLKGILFFHAASLATIERE